MTVILMSAAVLTGMAHSLFIAPATGAPSLHALSAMGYLVLIARLSWGPRVGHRRAAVLTAAQGLVLVLAAQRMMEAVVPAWPAVLTHPLLQEAWERIGIHADFSAETALGLFFLHLTALSFPRWPMLATVLLGGVWAVTSLVVLKALFRMTLWHTDLSIFSIACIGLGAFGLSREMRDTVLIRPFFEPGPSGRMFRLLLFASLVVPWGVGYLFFHIADIGMRAHDLLELLFGAVGWIMLSLVLAVAHFEGKARRHYVEMAQRDPLTGILNRAGIVARLDRGTAADGAGCDGILLLDLDHFKRVNDELGHAEGDSLLIEVGQVLEQARRDGDLAGRWGGEEFMMVFRDVDRAELDRLAEGLRQAIAAIPPRGQGRRTLPVTASLGSALLDPARDTFEAVVKLADIALYDAKRQGRNRHVTGSGSVGVLKGNGVRGRGACDGALLPLAVNRNDMVA